MKLQSSEVFKKNVDGTFTITRPVEIGGVHFDKVVFSRGVKVGHTDLTDLVDKELEVETKEDGTLQVKGYYVKD